MDNQPTLYSADWCSYCQSLKQWLETNQIKYQEKDVDDPTLRIEMNQLTGGNQTIPVLFVRDEYFINPSQKTLHQLFNVTKEEK